MWLAICNIEDKRARERTKARAKGTSLKGKDISRHLIEGATTTGWKPALQALAIAYPDRLTNNIK